MEPLHAFVLSNHNVLHVFACCVPSNGHKEHAIIKYKNDTYNAYKFATLGSHTYLANKAAQLNVCSAHLSTSAQAMRQRILVSAGAMHSSEKSPLALPQPLVHLCVQVTGQPVDINSSYKCEKKSRY